MVRMLIATAAALALGGCLSVHVTEHTEWTNEKTPAVDCAAKGSGASIKSTPVASRALENAPGKTLTSVRLDVPPGAVSNPHKHAGFVFVYVISGVVCSQVTGDAAPKPYKAGETFFEPPGSQHLAFSNGTSEPASVLVTFIADTGATLTTPLQ